MTTTALRHFAVGLVGLTLVILPAQPAAADATRNQQWHLKALNISQAHAITKGAGVVVAVVDTGVEADHPDLVGNVVPGLGLTGDGPKGWTDVDGHGTRMAGLIAGHGHGPHGQDGVLGIAPESKILPARVSTNNYIVPDAVKQSVARGAKVISISLAAGASPELRQAIDNAIASDVVVVAASGNRPDDIAFVYPSAYDGVVAVGATGKDGTIAPVTLTGGKMVLTAPGVDIVSTLPGRSYSIGTGTSDSTAIVAGAAALVRSKYPEMSAPDVIKLLTSTATDKGAPGRDDKYGFGVLNIVAALTVNSAATASPAPTATAATPAPAPTTPTTDAALPPADAGGTVNRSAVVVTLAGLVLALIAFVVAVVLLTRRAVRRKRTDTASGASARVPLEPTPTSPQAVQPVDHGDRNR